MNGPFLYMANVILITGMSPLFRVWSELLPGDLLRLQPENLAFVSEAFFK